MDLMDAELALVLVLLLRGGVALVYDGRDAWRGWKQWRRWHRWRGRA